MNIPDWAVTVGLAVYIISGAAWIYSRRSEKSEPQSAAEVSPTNQQVPSLNDQKISVPSESVHSLLNMIENRIRIIGETYQQDGRSYHDDVEIAALCAISRQLGFDFDVSAVPSGFIIIRVHRNAL